MGLFSCLRAAVVGKPLPEYRPPVTIITEDWEIRAPTLDEARRIAEELRGRFNRSVTLPPGSSVRRL